MEIPCNFKSKLCTHLRSEDFALIGPVQVRPAVTIKKGTWRNVPVIVKEYKQTGNEQRKMARNEARTFERVSRSPYIIHALGVTVSPTWIGLVFEALRYGTLDNAIVRFTLSQAIKLRIALEIARGLAFLHHKHIVHRNFRTNIVACLSLQASSPVLVRIASLSMAGHVRHGGGGGGALRGLTHLIHNNYVNPRYCAPEILTDQDVYGTEVDLYSYACVFYELWNEKTVFPDVGNDITPSDTFVSEIIEGKRPELADTCPPAVRNIIAKCWATDPKKRPTFEEVIAVLEAEGAGAENTTATPINGINPNSGFEGGGSATGPSVVPPGSPSLFYDETADAQEDETAGRTPLCEGQLMLRPCALDADLTMSPSPSVGASASPVPPTAQNPPTPLTFSLLSTSK